MMRKFKLVLIIIALISINGCATKIHGTVKLVDRNSQPVTSDVPVNITVNMINTSSSLENASHSVLTNDKGEFRSQGGKLEPGLYKVEVSRIGYKTATQTLEVKKRQSKKLDLFLRQISEGKRKSVRNLDKDQNKIINPGEVNIQPPSM